MPPGRFEAFWETLEPDRTLRLRLHAGGEALSCAQVVRGWQSDEHFAACFGEALGAAPFEAFFWEMPPVDRERIDRPFECVCVASRTLAGTAPDPEPFREHIGDSGDGASIAVFGSLGGDALLLAPRPRGRPSVYPHLATFLRGAPEDQKLELWREVGRHVEHRLGRRPCWISTSGLGVSWLHVRLDVFPKYYQHVPYRSPGHGLQDE